MLVDVVPLRREGAKLPAAEIERSTPMRGVLTLATRPWRYGYRPDLAAAPTVIATLARRDAKPNDLVVVTLRDARIQRLAGSAFVVLGIEDVGPWETSFSQAWWCRLVPGTMNDGGVVEHGPIRP